MGPEISAGSPPPSRRFDRLAGLPVLRRRDGCLGDGGRRRGGAAGPGLRTSPARRRWSGGLQRRPRRRARGSSRSPWGDGLPGRSAARPKWVPTAPPGGTRPSRTAGNPGRCGRACRAGGRRRRDCRCSLPYPRRRGARRLWREDVGGMLQRPPAREQRAGTALLWAVLEGAAHAVRDNPGGGGRHGPPRSASCGGGARSGRMVPAQGGRDRRSTGPGDGGARDRLDRAAPWLLGLDWVTIPNLAAAAKRPCARSIDASNRSPSLASLYYAGPGPALYDRVKGRGRLGAPPNARGRSGARDRPASIGARFVATYGTALAAIAVFLRLSPATSAPISSTPTNLLNIPQADQLPRHIGARLRPRLHRRRARTSPLPAVCSFRPPWFVGGLIHRGTSPALAVLARARRRGAAAGILNGAARHPPQDPVADRDASPPRLGRPTGSPSAVDRRRRLRRPPGNPRFPGRSARGQRARCAGAGAVDRRRPRSLVLFPAESRPGSALHLVFLHRRGPPRPARLARQSRRAGLKVFRARRLGFRRRAPRRCC